MWWKQLSKIDDLTYYAKNHDACDIKERLTQIVPDTKCKTLSVSCDR